MRSGKVRSCRVLPASDHPDFSEKIIAASENSAVGIALAAAALVTTISGPPLAVALNNQGFAKEEFRASLGIIRLAESSLTAIAYGSAGLLTPASLLLIPQIVPGVAIGAGCFARRVRPGAVPEWPAHRTPWAASI